MSDVKTLFLTMHYKKDGNLQEAAFVERKLAEIVGREPASVETVPGTGALNRRIEWHFETQEQCRNAARWLAEMGSLLQTAVVSVEKPVLPC